MRAHKLIPTGIVIVSILFLIVRFLRIDTDEFSTIFLIGPTGERREILVEVAETDVERQQGLMHRSTLPEGRGMLFLFDAPRELSFWMKNTLIPLEILYFDAHGDFVSRQSMVPCEADPCRNYPSFGASQYALEVGSTDPISEGVGEGWSIEF